MHLLSADTTMFEKNLAHQKLKKMAHNGPHFFSIPVWLPKRPKNRNFVPPKKPLNAGLGI